MIVVIVFLSILNQMESHLVQNWQENCHHDHIPFNSKGIGNLFSCVYCTACRGSIDRWRSLIGRRTSDTADQSQACFTYGFICCFFLPPSHNLDVFEYFSGIERNFIQTCLNLLLIQVAELINEYAQSTRTTVAHK